MIAVRYKETGSGIYSVYLDYFIKDDAGKSKRCYDFLKIYVSRDYGKSKRIAGTDKEKMELVQGIRSKKELELYGTVKELEGMAKRINVSLLDYIWNDYEKTQRRQYRFFHGHLKAFSGRKDILFSDVDVLFLNKLEEYLSARTSRNTTVLYLTMLKKFFNKACKEETIYFNPFSKYKIPSTIDTERTFLTLQDIRTLSETPVRFEPHIKHAFLFSCFSGLRFSDVKSLCYSHIREVKDKEGIIYSVLQIRPVKTTRTTGKILNVPLSEQAILILKELKKKTGTDVIFYNLPDRSVCNNWLKKWAKDADIEKNIHFHVSRHSFATLSLTSGIDIYTLSKLMGHTRLDSTQGYAKIIDEKKRKEVDKFPTFSFKKSA